MEEKLDRYMSLKFHLKEVDILNYSPLTLAYMGDAVYELIIRTLTTSQGNASVNILHKRSSDLVKASAQAHLIHILLPLLSEEEKAVYKRGRNANKATMAKNATVADYRAATGFEALCGYLYMTGQGKRLIDLLADGLTQIGVIIKHTDGSLHEI